MYVSLQEKQQQEETYARLTTPYHITHSHFSEHQSVQGMYMGEQLLEGSDRLLLLKNSFGAIQLGFSPREGKTFLFAHANRTRFAYKSAQERAYHSPRHNAMLYQTTAKPWSAQELSRQIRGRGTKTPTIRWLAQQIQNQKNHAPAAYESLFPFAQRMQEVNRRTVLAARSRAAEVEIRTLLQEETTQGQQQSVQQLRTQQREAMQEQNLLASILSRKDAQSLWFFHQANQSFDAQKQEIFTYYQTKASQSPTHTAKTTDLATDEDEEET